jgi:uncharacterized protein YbjT (DUF2867 family)
MQGLVTVFGGTGFVGAQVVRALARSGARVRVAVRNPGRGYRLRMLGDVGQIQVVQANIRNDDSIARALDGAEACVNLVGVLYGAGKQTFQAVHVHGAAAVAKAAANAGITRYVHMSAIGADATSASDYARTKGEGEAAVRAVIPQAVIIRPSIIFGPGDGFFERFAAMAQVSPVLPLIGGGKTRFQPVYVGDVAQAIARAGADAASAGHTYELGGPGTYTFKELMEIVCAVTMRKRILLPIPFAAASMLGVVGDVWAWKKGWLGLIPPPPITSDQVKQLHTGNVVAGGADGLAALGITPQALEPIVPTYLYRYRKDGQFAVASA